MYEDNNGNPLTQNDKAFALGTVVAVDSTHATVSLTKYGSEANLSFLRSEPIKASFADGKVSGQISGGPQAAVDDQVIILGAVAYLGDAIQDVAILAIVQNGMAEIPTFFCDEITKASIDEEHGVVSGPS